MTFLHHARRWSLVAISVGLVVGACSAAGPSSGTGGGGPSAAPSAAASAAPGGGSSAAPSAAAGGGGGGDVSSIDACSLLTAAEIQQALGVAMKPGAKLGDTTSSAQCQWDSQDDSAGVGVSVSVAPYDDTLFKQEASAKSATSVSGIGEAAFTGWPHAGDIAIKQGGYEIDLGIVDFTADQQKVAAADLALAKLVLSRL